MIVLYVILVLGGSYAEGYCLSNDYEQSVGRVFQQIVRMLDPRRTKQSRLGEDHCEQDRLSVDRRDHHADRF